MRGEHLLQASWEGSLGCELVGNVHDRCIRPAYPLMQEEEICGLKVRDERSCGEARGRRGEHLHATGLKVRDERTSRHKEDCWTLQDMRAAQHGAARAGAVGRGARGSSSSGGAVLGAVARRMRREWRRVGAVLSAGVKGVRSELLFSDDDNSYALYAMLLVPDCGRSSEVIRGHQGSSEVIRGHQRSSGVIRGHQGSSEVIRDHQRASEVIRGHPRSSEAIRGHPRASEGISGHQRSSEVIRGHQRSSEVIRGHQRSSYERSEPKTERTIWTTEGQRRGA